MHLYNKHTVFKDDDIATVNVTSAQLSAIYASGVVNHVVVAGQDRHQFLTISATVSKGASATK